MDVRELKPVFDILSGQEERLSKMIKELHETTKEIDTKVGIQNGRVTKLEINLKNLNDNCENKHEQLESRLSKISPSIKAARVVEKISSHPLTSIIIGFILLLISNLVVLFLVSKKMFWIIFDKII